MESIMSQEALQHDVVLLSFSEPLLHPQPRQGSEIAAARIASARVLGIPADLRGLSLSGADLSDTDLREARLDGVDLRGADLSGANLQGAQLRCADLRDAVLDMSRLQDADLSYASLQGASLESCRVSGAVFLNADLRGCRLHGIVDYQQANWLGVDLAGAHFCGAYRLRRFAMDQNYLHEFRQESQLHEHLYQLWWLTSDCGRSLGRWGVLTALIVVLFANLYPVLGVDFGEGATGVTPYYFSVVTLTSLGYGDISPHTPSGQVAAMAEVVLGYIMLGGLLSILTNKMSRRAD